MAFWNSANLQPKRKFRWVLQWKPPGDTGTTMQIAAKTANKPNYELGSTTHKFLNHSFFFPNRVEWKPITLTFVDHVGPGTSNGTTDILYRILGASGYKVPASVEDCSSAVTKGKAVRAMGGQVRLVQLGGDEDEVLETWILTNPWISKVTFGDLSYEDEGLIEISIDMVYDYARMKSGTKLADVPLIQQAKNAAKGGLG